MAHLHTKSCYWSSALNILSTSSRLSIMNRSMVQPWVFPSAPHCQPVHGRVWSKSPQHCPHLWLRFVDDTFVIQKAEHSQQLLHHINTQHPNIQFTVEEPNQEWSLPFWDTKVTPGPNSTLQTAVYRKIIHTDQYLHWDSNHFITAKHSVYNTLAYRAKVVSSN